MKKKSKRLIPAIIALVVCIIGLILAGSISSAVLRTIVTVAIILGIGVAALTGLLVVFANKAGQESPAPQASLNRKSPLSPEQTSDLKKAGSQLTRIRMTLSRFKDQKLAQSGIEACDSIDKVLQTLKGKPEKIQTTRQLFNYYLPTMEQVVNRYHKLEASGVDNPEIPDNLKKYFGDIKTAMASQYEGLFDNDKLNVAVDMEAMTIALKRDGLLDDVDFKNHSVGARSAAKTEMSVDKKQIMESKKAAQTSQPANRGAAVETQKPAAKETPVEEKPLAAKEVPQEAQKPADRKATVEEKPPAAVTMPPTEEGLEMEQQTYPPSSF